MQTLTLTLDHIALLSYEIKKKPEQNYNYTIKKAALPVLNSLRLIIGKVSINFFDYQSRKKYATLIQHHKLHS